MFSKVQQQARQLPCHRSFEIMIKWSYESFWSQFYMFLGQSFGAEFLGTPLQGQLR